MTDPITHENTMAEIDRLRAALATAERERDAERAKSAETLRQYRAAIESRAEAMRRLDETRARLATAEGLLSLVVKDHPDWDESDGDNGPGHAHTFPGVWDDTGLPCEWCALWRKWRAFLAGNPSPKPAERDTPRPDAEAKRQNHARVLALLDKWSMEDPDYDKRVMALLDEAMRGDTARPDAAAIIDDLAAYIRKCGHANGCAAYMDGDDECDCGYDAALRRAEEWKEAAR